MSSAATSGKSQRWGGGSGLKDGHRILLGELADLSAVTHNGSALSIQPEMGTGCWNWWESANARIVGEACDRFFDRKYRETKDRLIDSKAYAMARHERDFRLAVQARHLAAKEREINSHPANGEMVQP